MKPILFNTEMVKAILDGRKTTTRRIIKPKCRRNFIGTGIDETPAECRMIDIETQEIVRHVEPVYHRGDVLYVRETWNVNPAHAMNENFVGLPPTEEFAIYKASFPEFDGGWKPSIFMPKEAARIFLRVTDVKAERLQEIDKYWSNYDKEGMRDPKTENISIAMKEKFISIWDGTVKKSDRNKYGWDANPWVWVYTFERCEKQ